MKKKPKCMKVSVALQVQEAVGLLSGSLFHSYTQKRPVYIKKRPMFMEVGLFVMKVGLF